MKGVKPTDLDFLCQGEGCRRAFSSPQGLNVHRYLITNPETTSVSYFLIELILDLVLFEAALPEALK